MSFIVPKAPWHQELCCAYCNPCSMGEYLLCKLCLLVVLIYSENKLVVYTHRHFLIEISFPHATNDVIKQFYINIV